MISNQLFTDRKLGTLLHDKESIVYGLLSIEKMKK